MGAEWPAGALAMETWPRRSRGFMGSVLQGSWGLGTPPVPGAGMGYSSSGFHSGCSAWYSILDHLIGNLRYRHLYLINRVAARPKQIADRNSRNLLVTTRPHHNACQRESWLPILHH